MRRIWEGLGGETSQLACIGWLRVFRPLSFVSDYLVHRERFAKLALGVRPVFAPVDGIVARIRPGSVAEPTTDRSAITPDELATLIASVGENSSPTTRLRRGVHGLAPRRGRRCPNEG